MRKLNIIAVNIKKASNLPSNVRPDDGSLQLYSTTNKGSLQSLQSKLFKKYYICISLRSVTYINMNEAVNKSFKYRKLDSIFRNWKKYWIIKCETRCSVGQINYTKLVLVQKY